MLECVVNISEGRRPDVVAEVVAAAGRCVLDVHSDPHHHRSVITLAGPEVEAATRTLTEAAVDRIDLTTHAGAHPRLGAVDVVPFVPLAGSAMADAMAARDRFASWAAGVLGIPCFLYGPERSLPEVRRRAFRDLGPDRGPDQPHPTAGAVCAGARPVLVAYNLWLDSNDVDEARTIARDLRGVAVRALGLAAGGQAQVSCNLIDPLHFGPDAAYDGVAARAKVARAELVGLVPAAVLAAIPEARWPGLGLSASATIEARLEQAGLDGGSSLGPDRHSN